LQYNGTASVICRFRKDVGLRGDILYNILSEFGTPIKQVGLIKMYLKETYSKACVRKKTVL